MSSLLRHPGSPVFYTRVVRRRKNFCRRWYSACGERYIYVKPRLHENTCIAVLKYPGRSTSTRIQLDTTCISGLHVSAIYINAALRMVWIILPATSKRLLIYFSISFTVLSRVSTLMLTRDIDRAILSVCPSVCPWHAGIVWKRLNIPS